MNRRICIKKKAITIKRISFTSVATWLPLFFYLANLYRMTGHSSLPYLAIMCTAGGIGLVSILTDKRMKREVPLLLFAFYIFTAIMNWLLVGNLSLGDIISDLLLYGVMITMVMFPYSYRQGAITFYLIAAKFIAAFFSGVRANRVLTSSGNYVSILLVLAAAIYYIGVQNDNRKLTLIDIIPAVLCFWLSIWARGRGGILSCGLLLALILFFYMRQTAKKGEKYFLLIFVILSMAGTYLLWSDISIFDRLMGLGKWESRGLDNSSREIIWGAYYSKMMESLTYIFNGAPLANIPVISSFNNNTHNSFIQLHANNGLVMFLTFAILYLRTFFFQVKRKKWVLLSITIVLFVRGMTDKFIFGQYGMPIMLYLVFYPYFEEYIGMKKEHRTIIAERKL